MVYSSITAARQSYRLWQRFSIPSKDGPLDAIAVEASIGHELNSAYTFLLEQIVILVWGGVVLIGVLASLRRYEQSHSGCSIDAKIWAQRSSPFEMLKLTVTQIAKPMEIPRLSSIWLVLAVAFLAMKYAIPIIFARSIIIDNAAPVAVGAIYFPTYEGLNLVELLDPQKILDIYALEVPSALRAAGSIGSLNNTDSAAVSVDSPEVLPNQDNGTGLRISYRYMVTGLDFGLQQYPDLALNVEGSCVTVSTWLNRSIVLNYPDVVVNVDYYDLFGDGSIQNEYVSIFDGNHPIAKFYSNPNASPSANTSWAVIVSSVGRESYWPGTDPWYLTTQDLDPETGLYQVKPGRPALSCWENDIWSYRGNNSTVVGLNSTMLPGLDLPLALQDVFSYFLRQPKIYNLGMRLGSSALESVLGSFGGIFNASTSSIYNDLERLVLASYIATANTLTDTTLFPKNSGIANDVVNQTTLIPYPGVDQFVIWSSNIATLSVKSLIIIPILAALFWILFFGVLFLPIPILSALTVTLSVKNATAVRQDDLNGEATEPSQAEKLLGINL